MKFSTSRVLNASTEQRWSSTFASDTGPEHRIAEMPEASNYSNGDAGNRTRRSTQLCDPRRARVSGETRDFDVSGRVARIVGVTPTRSGHARARERGWSPLFRILCRGRRAVELMNAVRPMMGTRRRAQIDRALSALS
jgi:hypothetical protein